MIGRREVALPGNPPATWGQLYLVDVPLSGESERAPKASTLKSRPIRKSNGADVPRGEPDLGVPKHLAAGCAAASARRLCVATGMMAWNL
jgi:hypothetical protein